MVSVTDGPRNHGRLFLLLGSRSASRAKLLCCVVLLCASFFGAQFRLFEAGDAPPLVRWGDTVLVVYVRQAESVGLPMAADAGVAVTGNLHETESDHFADCRAHGVAMDAPFLELAASND